jgi:hypothetical protein
MMELLNLNIKNFNNAGEKICIEVESGCLDIKNCLLEGPVLIKNGAFLNISKSILSYCKIALEFQDFSRGVIESCTFFENSQICILILDESELSIECNSFSLNEKEMVGIFSKSKNEVTLSRNKFNGNGKNVKDEGGNIMLIQNEV